MTHDEFRAEVFAEVEVQRLGMTRPTDDWPMVVLLDTPRGKQAIAPPEGIAWDVLANTLIPGLIATEATNYVIVASTWASASAGELGIRASEAPDRAEFVVAMFGAIGVAPIGYTARIYRPARGRPALGKWERIQSPGGPMVDALPR